MNNITRIIREILANQSRDGLKTTVQRYFKDPNPYVKSERDHLNTACLRWFMDISERGHKDGWRGRMLYECAMEVRFNIQWHLIVDKNGRFLSDQEVTILQVHGE